MLTLLNTPLKSKIKANKMPFQYKIEMAKIKELSNYDQTAKERFCLTIF